MAQPARRPEMVDESLELEMYALAIDRLTSAGFEHYEVSNFARDGCRSRHNETYWSGAGYYAAGPGASRYVQGIREANHRSTTTYIRRVLAGESAVAEREQLSPEARAALPYNPDEPMKTFELDFVTVSRDRPAWTEQFNKEVSSKK